MVRCVARGRGRCVARGRGRCVIRARGRCMVRARSRCVIRGRGRCMARNRGRYIGIGRGRGSSQRGLSRGKGGCRCLCCSAQRSNVLAGLSCTAWQPGVCHLCTANRTSETVCHSPHQRPLGTVQKRHVKDLHRVSISSTSKGPVVFAVTWVQSTKQVCCNAISHCDKFVAQRMKIFFFLFMMFDLC